MTVLKCKSGHVIPHLKILHGSHVTVACKTLLDGPYHFFELIPNHPFPCSLCASYTGLPAISHPLQIHCYHLCTHFSGMFFPPLDIWLLSFTSGFLFKCDFLRKVFPDHAQKLQSHLLYLLSIFPASFLSVAPTIRFYMTDFKFYLLLSA